MATSNFARSLLLIAMLTPAVGWSAPKIIENNFGDVFPGETSGDASPPFVPLDDAAPSAPARVSSGPSIWSMPQVHDRLVKLRLATALLFKQGRFTDAEKAAQRAVDMVPHDANGYYLLACTQARQGNNDAALLSLSRAVDRGFNQSQKMSVDPNLKSLHESLRFAELIAAARVAQTPPNPWAKRIAPSPVVNGAVTVSARNTGWNSKYGSFVSVFGLPQRPTADGSLQGRLGEEINKWYREGTAAGNHGDFYDNRDNKHSEPALKNVPHVTRIVYDEETRKMQLHQGLQTRFLFNGVVVGNSSTAMVNGPYWRSQARLAYASKRSAYALYLQYANNHLYCYPEHRDHDPSHGDVFPANTPYIIVSQGSSHSDRAGMNAVFYTLAAFRPEVKQKLIKNNALMPTIQLLLRYCHSKLKDPADYLTGKAHPTVFDPHGFSTERMVNSAHALTTETLPPLVKLKVVEDDVSQNGRDYFDIAARQEIFTTPCAIARVHRTTNYRYRMVVSAEDSSDLNNRDLTYHWKVLRGDPDKITIKPLNESGSVVELLVGYHPKFDIGDGTKLQTNRVDIGCFVHNGLFYSAPSFVTFFSLASEKREYLEGNLIGSVEYNTPATGGDYVDPMIDIPKHWKDIYQYDADDNLIGWVRDRDGARERFTADGAKIFARDEFGRPTKAQTVRYTARRTSDKEAPVLVQIAGNEVLHYAYDSPEDRVGRVVRREALPSN